ncbi:YodC family protein [Cognatilysobacter lacus]|uniref:DUF2158 domain-containing protein n=1 Tax=Cognatilysobacter lacus TaxID=1643323 RepID=A0A5D8YRM5_9GAMM|nr:YodC family protein [Lysobacter lacus]TZF85241.1 DUF2158 domain-containing protein [Lysobacter lacus]
MKFKIGDVVQLRSGGPHMTVQNIGEYVVANPGVMCVWFDGSKKLEDVFHPDSLELYSRAAEG